MTGRARFFSAPRSARRWITALALLAFFFQNLAVQTHIHQSLQPEAVKVQTDGSHKAPLKLDPVEQNQQNQKQKQQKQKHEKTPTRKAESRK